jgi:hypothetical protein
MSIARTLLLHSAIHWPDVADPQLWPMAVDHAIFLHKHTSREDTNLSPHDLFTKLRWPHAKFHDLLIWGCALYTLDKRIADGHKLPRWQARYQREPHTEHPNQRESSQQRERSDAPRPQVALRPTPTTPMHYNDNAAAPAIAHTPRPTLIRPPLTTVPVEREREPTLSSTDSQKSRTPESKSSQDPCVIRELARLAVGPMSQTPLDLHVITSHPNATATNPSSKMTTTTAPAPTSALTQMTVSLTTLKSCFTSLIRQCGMTSTNASRAHRN